MELLGDFIFDLLNDYKHVRRTIKFTIKTKRIENFLNSQPF